MTMVMVNTVASVKTMLKFCVIQSRRFSMGKPSSLEAWELLLPHNNKKTEKVNEEKEKFTPAFKHYLETRLTLEDLMKSEDEARKCTASTTSTAIVSTATPTNE